MPVTIADAARAGAATATDKAVAAKSGPRYLFSSALAGAYVGIAVVLLASVVGPLAATSSAATRLTAGAVFGIALTLVVFAGAELFTGNNMFMLQGLYARAVATRDVISVWSASFVGNLVGSVALASIVHASGTLALGATPGTPGVAQSMVAMLIETKNAATGPQLFWRAVLCNLLVCLGLWMAARTKSDAAKLGVMWWALLAFVASGFEHSVANMTLYSLGIFDGAATWPDLARNLAWTVPGNVVGGGILVGLGYAYIGGARPALETRMLEDDGLRPAALG